MALISLRNISRTFIMGGNEVHALQEIDLDIEEGEFVAIIGPSGSGKSTLMYLLGLLDSPSAGSYRLGGEEVGGLDDRRLSQIRNRDIGYVFQSYNLLAGLDLRENIALGLVYAGQPAGERRGVAEALARDLGLGHRLDHTPRELSGGQMQRVAIARGLAGRPRLVLADEPTGNLDQRTGQEIMAILRRLHADGRTIVLVTHDPTVAAQADRVIRIVDGRITSDERTAPPPSLSSRPGGEASSGGVRSGDLVRMALREGLLAHRLRTGLTTLGIVFGIAAVVAMTAITEGGKEEQLKAIRQIGMSNIQVRSLDLEGSRLLRARRTNPEGLAQRDLDNLLSCVPGVKASTAWKTLKAEVRGRAAPGRMPPVVEDAGVLGLTGDFQEVTDFRVGRGRFLLPEDEAGRRRVCVLGADIAEGLQLGDEALGAVVMVGDEPFSVVGVMRRKAFSKGGVGDVSVGDRNRDLYLPRSTLAAFFRKGERESQFDTISLRMDGDELLAERAEVIRRIIAELHQGADDFAVAVPLEVLKQAQRTKEIFNVIIIVIAAISLLVGGIGIMNIMLANVTERTREIGIRRAVGASRQDILRQFLCEALLIATVGGLAGLLLGVAAGYLVEFVFGFPVAFNALIMLVATATSMLVGIGFGLWPAWKAARMDPVDALRTG